MRVSSNEAIRVYAAANVAMSHRTRGYQLPITVTIAITMSNLSEYPHFSTQTLVPYIRITTAITAMP
jgi:hypothetical protein